MSPDAVHQAMSHLVAATPGWSDESAVEYFDQLVGLDDGEALERACVSIARSWSELRRPPLATILESYDREVKLAAPKALDPVRVHCDGSGWRWVAGELRPCARCNPVVAQMYTDTNPDAWDAYRRGGHLEFLDVGVESVGGRLRVKGGGRLPECRPAFEHEMVPPPSTGRAIAEKAYAEACREAGREPSRGHFDRMAGE